MLVWLLLLALIIAEVVGLWVWLHREYYPVLFNAWAIILYTLTFFIDVLLVWLVSPVIDASASPGLGTVAVFAMIALVLVFAFTMFLRWVVRQDLPEPPK
jgi:hypothetical protein